MLFVSNRFFSQWTLHDHFQHADIKLFLFYLYFIKQTYPNCFQIVNFLYINLTLVIIAFGNNCLYAINGTHLILMNISDFVLVLLHF